MKWKEIIYAFVGIFIILGIFSIFSNTSSNSITDINILDDVSDMITNNSNLIYDYGALDSNGKFKETKKTLYTKDFIEMKPFDELKCELDFENNINYELYFYDENEIFISSTKLNKNFNYTAKETINVKIVITPNLKKDEEIKSYEKNKYINQLKVDLIKTDKVLDTLIIHIQDYENVIDEEYIIIKYVKGWTWREWVNSEFNNLNVVSDEILQIYYSHTQTIVEYRVFEPTYEFEWVYLDDVMDNTRYIEFSV